MENPIKPSLTIEKLAQSVKSGVRFADITFADAEGNQQSKFNGLRGRRLFEKTFRPPVEIQGWEIGPAVPRNERFRGYNLFYAMLPEALRRFDVFDTTLGFRFCPSGHGPLWVPYSID